MEVREFSREIRAAWELVKRLKLDRGVSSLASLAVDKEYRDVILDADEKYADIYRYALERSIYNIILKDYSYFQYTWISSESWRLAYCPNPWIAGDKKALATVLEWEGQVERGEIDTEDMTSLIDLMPYNGAVPTIRFEYARSQYVEVAHPAAHFHIGRDFENRWPSSILLGPKAFTLLIASLYYSEEWSRASSVRGAARQNECIDAEFSTVAASVAISHEFSALERRRFHFGRDTLLPR
jgi:hypothetical protein